MAEDRRPYRAQGGGLCAADAGTLWNLRRRSQCRLDLLLVMRSESPRRPIVRLVRRSTERSRRAVLQCLREIAGGLNSIVLCACLIALQHNIRFAQSSTLPILFSPCFRQVETSRVSDGNRLKW